MHTDAKSLKEDGDKLFRDKTGLDLRNQELATNFYPERADFTLNRTLGQEFASDLMTGYPTLVRRDLGDAIGSMLRPRGKQWFHMALPHDAKADYDAKKWMEWATTTQYRAMADPIANFTRATKQGDHDFATFGNPVLQCEMNRRDVALLYRSWHPRDCVWREDGYDQLCAIHRNWKPTAKQLIKLFKNVHQHVADASVKEPDRKFPVRHIIISTIEYDASKRLNQKWASLYIDLDNEHLMEEKGSVTRQYVIPRWMTVSGSQYAYSPAALCALPDARLIQAMTLTLLQAGEKAVDPPMVGVSEAIRGDVDIRAGGFTAVDLEYDERLGEVLRPLTQDKSGLPFGLELSDRISAMLTKAFYLDALELPPHGGPEMTAFEVGQRVQEYIRRALPLFEPMEAEYNGALCEITFETMLHNGGFGPIDSIPESVGSDVSFKFESPLADMIERQKGQTFMESKAMIAEAMALDPNAAAIVDFPETLRDVLDGIGAPKKWMRSPDEVQQLADQQAAQQEIAATMDRMEQGANVAQKLGVQADQFAEAAI